MTRMIWKRQDNDIKEKGNSKMVRMEGHSYWQGAKMWQSAIGWKSIFLGFWWIFHTSLKESWNPSSHN